MREKRMRRWSAVLLLLLLLLLPRHMCVEIKMNVSCEFRGGGFCKLIPGQWFSAN